MDKAMFKERTILLIGGTGSLGHQLTNEIMTGNYGIPKKVIIFSRDEDKHYQMKLQYKNINIATDEIYYRNLEEILDFRIGDVRDYESVVRSIREADIVIHCAALKHVPVCEYFPKESVDTNVNG